MVGGSFSGLPDPSNQTHWAEFPARLGLEYDCETRLQHHPAVIKVHGHGNAYDPMNAISGSESSTVTRLPCELLIHLYKHLSLYYKICALYYYFMNSAYDHYEIILLKPSIQ